jgi:hypothetical protein
MMRAWQFPLEEFQQTLRRFEKTRPDPAKVKEYLGYVAKQWDTRFGRSRNHPYVTYGDDEDLDADAEGGAGG